MMGVPERVPRVEMPPLDEIGDDRFARFLAIAIVVTTLLGAGIEYLHSRDANRANDASIQAQRTGIQRQGAELLSIEEAQAQVSNFGLSQEERTRAANALQAQLLPGSAAQSQSLQLEQARWASLANLSETVSQISAAGPTAPLQDSRFPARLFADKAVTADRLLALQDAYGEERANWQNRLGHYAAILTFLAVAVYLFGLALTLKTHLRLLLAGFGIAFVVIGAAWALVLQLTPPAAADERAADEFAAARHAMNTAYLLPGAEAWKQADLHYSQAIQLRPTYAIAYHERAFVRFYLGSPQQGVAYIYVNIAKPDSVRAAIADDRKAYDLGLHTVPVLLNLGFFTYIDGVIEKQPQLFAKSLSYSEQALSLTNSTPTPGVLQALLYLNEGVAVLAQGHVDQAETLTRQFVDHIVYTDAAKKTLRQDPVAEEYMLGAGLSGLGILADFRPDLSARIGHLKELIVNGVSRPDKPAATSTVSLTNLKADVFGEALQWTANLAGLRPSSDVVSMQWYYQNPLTPAWTVLAQSSGTFTPTVNTGAGPNAYFFHEPSLTANKQCLSEGQYRVELYINGRLAGQAQTEVRFGSNQAAVLPDLGVNLCHPRDWKPVDVVTSFASGFVSIDKSRGIYVFRYQDLDAAARAENATALSSRVRSAALLAFADRFPGVLTFEQNPPIQYFLGLNGQNVSRYTYPGGRALVGAGRTANNEVIVGIVFGPQAAWDDGTAYSLFDAMVLNG